MTTNGVYVLVADPHTRRFLLLHRKLHWQGWEFVKGWRERGEVVLETAKREVKEEAGITVDQLLELHTPLSFRDHDIDRVFESFLALVPEQSAHFGLEHDDARWVTSEEAQTLLYHKNTLPFLEAAIQQLPQL